MWCKKCRQDVPSVPSKSGRLRCLRCGTFVANDTTAESTVNVASGVGAMADCGLELDAGAPTRSKPSLDFDDWDLDPDLRSFKNARHAAKVREYPTVPPRATSYRIDGAHPTTLAWQPTAFEPVPQMMQFAEERPSERHETAKRASWLAWAVMSLGLMAFTCGGVLLGWSFMSSRPDLWNLGMPVTVAGQIMLLVGLVLQLERIWQNNRYAVDKLEEVDERLADIKHSQSLLRVSHSSPAQAFYTHMAEGANPSLLLADLKGQLDLLAVKLAERRS
jgi:uncharacterized membrane protein YidH (DUF202 family)